MYFENLSAVLEMDGHGVFVWAAVLISLLLMLSQIVVPVLRTRRFFSRQRMLLRRQQK